jgi:hypothetical protein
MKIFSACVRRLQLGLLVAFALIASGCVNMYVDLGTKEIPSAQFKKPATLQEAQLLFEFQTKGAKNDRATTLLREKVLNQVRESGLFSKVTETAVPSGAILSIVLNNVPITDPGDAAAKGFVTGLTFGLAGSQVSDGYVCTAKYLPPNGGASISAEAKHALHTSIGAGSPPKNAVKAESVSEAVFTMTKQIVSNVLLGVSSDSAFK